MKNFLKKMTLPLLIIFIATTILFYDQYNSQKQELYYQTNVMAQNYLLHLDRFLEYQETLIDIEWSAEQKEEYNERLRGLEWHGNGSVMLIDLDDKEVQELRFIFGDIRTEIYYFGDVTTPAERKERFENVLNMRNELQSSIDYLNENYPIPDA
ncbi:hypothetical protein [Jeotgalibacillus salarius]|uniref:Uncharacterized protein n=1 Tax=Jeotgalibacillus salarius TaxID=546023 RepID=A0A4Y8LHK7_9BACL|nr:hypothetical protein [Jeotgalibacillus salarius]TFE02282.1 hypothetical protein E2626_06800 [Jeotgalibacillus salarius]